MDAHRRPVDKGYPLSATLSLLLVAKANERKAQVSSITTMRGGQRLLSRARRGTRAAALSAALATCAASAVAAGPAGASDGGYAITAAVFVGDNPGAVAVSPDGNLVYVPDSVYFAGTVAVGRCRHPDLSQGVSSGGRRSDSSPCLAGWPGGYQPRHRLPVRDHGRSGRDAVVHARMRSGGSPPAGWSPVTPAPGSAAQRGSQVMRN
jgi:hypothetical protein